MGDEFVTSGRRNTQILHGDNEKSVLYDIKFILYVIQITLYQKP